MRYRPELFKRLLRRTLRILGKIVMPVNQRQNHYQNRNQNHNVAGAGLQRTLSSQKLRGLQQTVLLQTFLGPHSLLLEIVDFMHSQGLIYNGGLQMYWKLLLPMEAVSTLGPAAANLKPLKITQVIFIILNNSALNRMLPKEDIHPVWPICLPY